MKYITGEQAIELFNTIGCKEMRGYYEWVLNDGSVLGLHVSGSGDMDWYHEAAIQD